MKMDIARRWKPKRILVWKRASDSLRAQRIIAMFPDAGVEYIDQQRIAADPAKSMGQALQTGKQTLMIGETSSFVRHFDGQLGDTVRCCPYYKLVPISNGCPYYCTYCYLALVYRKYAPFIKVNINYERMLDQISKVMDATGGQADFNMGEMLDSLALDHVTDLTDVLVPFFASTGKGHLMLLTKSSNVEGLLSQKPSSNIVVSWSLNSRLVIQTHEKGTANLEERVAAARACQQAGWRIRYRFDPLMLYDGWEDDYAAAVECALTQTEPENITLGTLRFLPGHPKLAADAYGRRGRVLYVGRFIGGASDHKLRYPPQDRIACYSHIIELIRNFNRSVSIGLCKESPEVWSALADHCDHGKCNCVTWDSR